MRHRSVASVIDEVIFLKHNYPFNTLYISDDELLYNGKKWMEELCTAFIEKGLNVRWTCNARVDHIEENLIRLMKKAGCYAIAIGVESGSDVILKYMRKGYTSGQIDKAFEICRRNKMITTSNFMIGTPGETKETLQSSIDLLRRIRPNLVRCSITTPTPGCDLYVQLKKENRINIKHLSDFDRWAAYPIRLDNISKEDIQTAMKTLLNVFYKNFFSIFINPVRIVQESYFLKILFLRYLLLLKNPVLILKDVFFYLTYCKHRKGYDSA